MFGTSTAFSFQLVTTVTSPLSYFRFCCDCSDDSLREFDASVVILHHSTMISSGYQPVVHCGVLRQSAQIMSIDGAEALKTGERKCSYLFVAPSLHLNA